MSTATPAPPPSNGAIRVTVWECGQGLGGLSSSINIWAGDWRNSGTGASVEFSVPGQYGKVGWGVTLPTGWTASPTSGEAAVGSSVDVVATSSACFSSDDPRTPRPSSPGPTPVPTTAWRPCSGTHGPRGSYIAVSLPGTPSQTYGGTEGFDRINLPINALSVDAPIVAASQPLTASFNFSTLKASDFAADHYGEGLISLRIKDVTTGRTRLFVDTYRNKAFEDGYGLRLNQPVANDVSFGGSFRFWNLSGDTWGYSSPAPTKDWFIRHTAGVWNVTFVPEAGHRYLIASMAAHDACEPNFAMWSVAVVEAQCPDGAFCPTPVPQPPDQPLPTPLPTPLPPPPPPAATGDVRLLMQSRHDPNHGGAAARDGVYRSTGTTVAWPQGEILDFAPGVTLAPLPPAPVDPFYGSRYRFEQQILGWSFVTAAPCRGAGKAENTLDGCRYEYVPDPTEAQLAGQARALWAGGNPAPVPRDVYATTMDGLAPVQLPLQVLVETRTVAANGTVVLRRLSTLSATFKVELVAPRSVR